MKKLKGLIYTFAFMLALIIPSINAKAAGYTETENMTWRTTVTGSQSTGGAGAGTVTNAGAMVMQGYDCEMMVKITLTYGTGGTENKWITIPGSSPTEDGAVQLMKAAWDEYKYGFRKFCDENNQHALSAADKIVGINYYQYSDIQLTPSYVKKSEATRHYGYSVYCGYVLANKSAPGKITAADVVAGFNAGTQSQKLLGTCKVGGQDDYRPMKGTSDAVRSTADKIIAYPPTDTLEAFFNAFGVNFPGTTVQSLEAQIKSASSQVTLPFMCATIAMSTGHSGGIADLIKGHLNPWTTSESQAKSFFARYDGGDSLISSLMQAGNSSIQLSSATPIYSKYVYPFGEGEIEIDSDFIFGVESSPKDATTDWIKDLDDKRRGTFRVGVMAAKPTGIDANAMYTIKITATPVNAMYEGPFCVATPVEIETKEVKGSDLAKEKPTYITIKVTGGSPQNPAENILNKGVLKFNVTVESGVISKQAQFDPSISDETALGSGFDGYNYVAWRHVGGDVPPPTTDLDLVPWAHHSAADPLINGTLGASEYNNEDWETGTGIPSTENVYVLAGGETAVSDLAGYFVIHGSDGNSGYTEVHTTNQGENEPGDSSGNPSVTREILMSCEVQNTWGWDNTLCHRQAAKFGVSGGTVCYTGEGNGWSCNGGTQHTGAHGTSGMHCAGSHTPGNQNNVVAFGACHVHGTKWTAGTGEKGYECNHNTCSACNGDTTDPVTGAISENICGGASPNSDSPQAVDHDCHWFLNVYDGDKDDGVNVGVTSDAAIDLPQSFTITVSGWQPLEMDSFVVTSYTPGAKGDKGQSFWKEAVLEAERGHDSNTEVTGSMTWTQQGNQYFNITGSFQVRQLAVAKGPCVSGCGNHFTSMWQDVSTGAGTTEQATLTADTPTGLLCDGYSYGTGSKCDKYENCYHLEPHKYTLKYLERIDFYVFRTVTDAHLAAMRGSEISGVNSITRSGYSEMNGTYGAPISDEVVGESATAPESVGYLWRCINTKYGSYVNGEGLETGNGEYNGRILFEIWKEPEAGAGGALAYEFNTNFCLGNAEIKAVLLQDNQFGNDANIKAQRHPTESLTSLPNSMPNRGDSEDRYNHNHVTSEERGKGKGSQYAGKPGDCLNEGWVAESHWKANDDTAKSEYKDIIIAEQNAVVNYWQGKNKDDNYHANIISDSLVYGGKDMTTQVVGEYYSVDEGIPLFNYLGGTEDRNVLDYEEGPIYRNHHSDKGSGKNELAEFILNYKAPTAPMMDDAAHYGYFGFGGMGDGGDTALIETLTGKCVEGVIYEIENGNKGSWVPGSDVIDAYRRKLGSRALYPVSNNMSGITEFHSYLPDAPSPGGDSFSGYWNDHEYPAHVEETVYGECNTSTGQSESFEDLPDFEFTGTNSGTLNQSTYGQSLLMHNLPLVDWTPNGVWPTVEINNDYGWLLEIESEFLDVLAKLNENGVYDQHKNIVSNGLGMALPETIRIYDPISVENSYNIGNQYGAWSGDEVITPDYSKYDQRVSSIGKAKNDFAAIGNYVNTNTYLWTWIAPFGDFSSVGGSGGDGSDVTTAEVYRNSGVNGYTSEMYIGTWTKDLKIEYPFIGKAKNNNKVSQEFYIDELDNVYGSGNSEYIEAQYGPDTLQNFYTSIANPVFKFGNAVGALNTVNLEEGTDLPVTITGYAINDGIQQGDNACSYGETINASGRNDDKWCNAASKVMPIDLVGQIGNLAIHDTTDFRFSTYFKRAKDTWLIDGIVHDTDGSDPLHILAEPLDILFQNAENKIYKHSTLGITDLDAPAGRYSGRGLAGEFGLLPLTPAYITVPEYKTDAMRLGYKAFASIETIGNYDAAHKPGVKYPTNFDQAQNPAFDTRDEYLEIKSDYYLYDFDTGLFYAVDLWSGPEGAKQCIYSGSDGEVHAQENSEPLYINMDEEADRRNVSILESMLSKACYRMGTNSEESSIYTAMMSGLEFIGYTGYIKLDTMDLTYIGSDAVQGIEGYNTDPLNMFNERSDNSQRWHFTVGLTSTTTPTMPIYSTGVNLTATQVENAYRDLHEKHPNAVIVEFQNYIAAGSVWTLKYKGSLMNTDIIKFYSSPDDCPYQEKGHISTEYKGYPIYNPATETKYGVMTIDADSTPIVAYEAWKSNSEDRTVAGTH